MQCHCGSSGSVASESDEFDPEATLDGCDIGRSARPNPSLALALALYDRCLVLLLVWQVFQRKSPTTTDAAPARPASRNFQNGEEPEQLVSSPWDVVVVVEVVVG